MPASPTAESPVIAFTPRGHAVLGPWRQALARHRRVIGIWGADGADLRRWMFGLAPRDPDPPRLLPLAPGAHWIPAHGRWLRRKWPEAAAAVLTRPDQAALLPALSGLRILYYAIDDFDTYGRDWGSDERAVLAAATDVVCVSSALADRLAQRTPEASRPRYHVLPNAVPADWIPDASRPKPTHETLRLPAPVAGVLGRVSSRLRLDWLLSAIDALPWLHWVFAGDIEWSEVTPEDRPRIAALRAHPRCRITGAIPFARMREYAAAIDLAVLPYSARSTNPCGSPVRLFIHLPFRAPLVATPGCAQIDEFRHVVQVCDSADALIAELAKWRELGFDDPKRALRWDTAHAHTWDARAELWRDLLGQPKP